MKYELSEIDAETFGNLLYNYLISDGVEKGPEDFLYSFKDVDTIRFIITAKIIHLFPPELHPYIKIAIKNRLGLIDDKELKIIRNEFDENHMKNDFHNTLKNIIYSFLFSENECYEKGTDDPYLALGFYFDWLTPIAENVYLDLDEIISSYYQDKKNNINSLEKLEI